MPRPTRSRWWNASGGGATIPKNPPAFLGLWTKADEYGKPGLGMRGLDRCRNGSSAYGTRPGEVTLRERSLAADIESDVFCAGYAVIATNVDMTVTSAC